LFGAARTKYIHNSAEHEVLETSHLDDWKGGERALNSFWEFEKYTVDSG
jgi:hypothetical protein